MTFQIPKHFQHFIRSDRMCSSSCQTQQHLQVFSCCLGVSQSYSRECFSGEVSCIQLCLFILDKERGQFPTTGNFLPVAVVTFHGFWWAFRESRYPNVSIEKVNKNNPRKAYARKKPWLAIFPSTTFPDLEHWSHASWEESNGSCYVHLLWRKTM